MVSIYHYWNGCCYLWYERIIKGCIIGKVQKVSLWNDYRNYTKKEYNERFNMLNKKYYYGITKDTDLHSLVNQVCDCLGYGFNRTADKLLLETLASETGMGQVEDKTKNAGMGIAQFDRLPFEDTKLRASKTDKLKIYNTFGIVLDYVEWNELRYNPLLNIIFARLKYKKVVEEIPNTREARYFYYKEHYNSYLGKATEKHYHEMCEKYLDV